MKNFRRIIEAISLCILMCFGYNFQLYAKAMIPQLSKGLTFDIAYMQGRQDDTLILRIGTQYLQGNNFVSRPAEYKATKNKDGRFHFNVPVKTNAGYFTLTTKRTYTYDGDRENSMDLIYPQFWEDGDSVQIYINHWEVPIGIRSLCKFQGKGAAKYKARYSLQEIQLTSEPLSDDNDFPFVGYMNPTASTIKKLSKLEKYKKEISDISYKVLLADIYYEHKDAVFFAVKECYARLYNDNNADSLKRFIAGFKKEFEGKRPIDLSNNVLIYSPEYLNYTYRKADAVSFFKTISLSPDTLFDVLVTTNTGEIRDILLTKFFLTERSSNNIESQFKKAEQIASSPEAKQLLKQYSTVLPGRKLNNYSLTDISGKKIHLADYDNKIVLLDFYFTGCGGCSTFYKNVLAKVEAKFRNNPNVVFISVSTDGSTKKWKDGFTKGMYTSKEAINVYTEGLGINHPIIVENNVYVFPVAVLLDRGRKLSLFGTENLYTYESLVKEIEKLLK